MSGWSSRDAAPAAEAARFRLEWGGASPAASASSTKSAWSSSRGFGGRPRFCSTITPKQKEIQQALAGIRANKGSRKEASGTEAYRAAQGGERLLHRGFRIYLRRTSEP